MISSYKERKVVVDMQQNYERTNNMKTKKEFKN